MVYRTAGEGSNRLARSRSSMYHVTMIKHQLEPIRIKHHHAAGIFFLAALAIAVSTAYGFGLFSTPKASQAASGSSDAAVPLGVFTGQPQSEADLARCAVIGTGKKANSYYYLASEIDPNKLSWHERYCFATTQDAESNGFHYVKAPSYTTR